MFASAGGSAQPRNRAARRNGLVHLVSAIGLLALLAVVTAPFASHVAAQASQTIEPAQSLNQWSAPRTVFIAETGQSIDGVFLDQWRAGGIASYGYPISPEVQQDGHTVQYYQYARFEYWPEDVDGQVVHLGKVGSELRPQVVQRYSFIRPSTSAKGSDTAGEMAKATRAWLPLGDKFAKRQNTDTWRYVPETKHSVSNGFKSYWEATGEAAYLGNPLSQEYILKGVTYQVFEYGQLAWQEETGVSQVEIGQVLAKKYGISTAPQGQGDLPLYSEDLFIAPKTTPGGGTGERWIDINLSAQYLVAYEGDTPVLETYVSTGREGFDTPTGEYFVLTKVDSQTMEGVLGGEYYNVPDVPYVMYFTNGGHAIHGTYWHSNFGWTMSHGCVNLPMDIAAWMYGWAPYGMRIEIHY